MDNTNNRFFGENNFDDVNLTFNDTSSNITFFINSINELKNTHNIKDDKHYELYNLFINYNDSEIQTMLDILDKYNEIKIFEFINNIRLIIDNIECGYAVNSKNIIKLKRNLSLLISFIKSFNNTILNYNIELLNQILGNSNNRNLTYKVEDINYTNNYWITRGAKDYLVIFFPEGGKNIGHFFSTKKLEKIYNIDLEKEQINFYSHSKNILSTDIIFDTNKINFYNSLLEQLYRPEMLSIINQDLQIDITNLTFQTQVHLLRYLWEQTTNNFEVFKQTLHNIQGEHNKYNFLTTFLACTEDLSLGDKIIELANKPGAEEIFETYSELVELQGEVVQDNIDSSAFLKVILSRGKKLLEKGEVDESVTAEIVEGGAFIKAFLSKQKKGEMINQDDFNKNPYFRLSSFNGGDIFKKGIDLKSLDVIELMSDGPYKKPEIFGGKDYKMLYTNIYETYQGNDNGAVNVNISGIINDLSNPKVTFYKISEKIDNNKNGILNEPISYCKVLDKGNNEVYFGSHYSEEEYIGDFGIGGFIADYAFNENKDSDILALAVINNSALEYQINHMGFIATKVTSVKNEDGISTKSLLEMKKSDNNDSFLSKDNEQYSNNFIINNVGKSIDNIDIVCLDSRDGFYNDYINTLNKYFEQGYVVTRLVYDKVDGKQNKEKTYLVFEKDL